MGQYHYCVSLTRKEYIYPHQLGDGLKLYEQAASGPGGIGSALILLLACSNGRGGGDFNETLNDFVAGRWAGNRLAIVGDYAEDRDLAPEFEASRIYDRCHEMDQCEEYECSQPKGEHYTNITPLVRQALAAELEMEYAGTGWMRRKFKHE